MERVQHIVTSGKRQHATNYWKKTDTDDKEQRIDEALYGNRWLVDGEYDVEVTVAVVNVDRRKAKKAGKFQINTRITSLTENLSLSLGYSAWYLYLGIPAIVLVFCGIYLFIYKD